MEITAANQVEAADLSENTSKVLSSAHGTGGRSENITRIDRELYEAAVKGDFKEFIHVQNVENLLTPNKNSVLHIHLTSQTKGNASIPFVEHILDSCRDLVLFPNTKGETPLHMAARYGHSSIAKLLIEFERAKAFPQDIESGITGADKKLIRATNRENDTALHEAVRYDHIEVVEILLEMDPDHSYSANNSKETPLYLASERQSKHVVRKILEKLKSPAYDGPSDLTALHAAVINRDLEMARDLLENEHLRASFKHADKIGWVPLHHATKIGDRELTELLLKQDENTAYMRDNEGRTALHIAVYCNHWHIMKMIIKCCPDCSELVDNRGCNALHYAVKTNNILMVEEIIRNLSLSNLFNEKDVDGNTPLHHLATTGGPNVRIIDQRGVDKHASNKEDQTALDFACANIDDSHSDTIAMHQFMIRRLQDAGVRRNQLLHLNPEYGQERSQQLEFSKEAKETHVIVATLIATVSFAAGSTLPGGTIQDGEHQGSPILGQRASFKAFIVSDTVALVLSASAAFIHLFSPLSKAKWKDHFLSEVAFSFTLVAVAAMIIAFSTGTHAVLGSSSIGIAVLCTGLSFFLVFRQVLQLNFRGSFLFSFIKNVVDVMLFSFLSVSSALFSLQFRRALADLCREFFWTLSKKREIKSDRAERRTIF